MTAADRRRRAHGRIDEELVTVDALKHVLLTKCGCLNVDIHREEDDPPDFTVLIDGASFPTEVTSIVLRQDYSAHCEQLAKVIRKRAEDLGILNGAYALIVRRFPHIPKHSSKDGRQLLENAVANIRATQHLSTSPKVPLVPDNTGKIGLKKLSPNGAYVSLRHFSVKGEGDTQSELPAMIQDRIDVKRNLLQGKGIGPQKALLLLYDAYGYAEPEDAMAALKQVTGYDWFHTVFWAASFRDRENTTYPEEPGREGIILFSHNPCWNGKGTV